MGPIGIDLDNTIVCYDRVFTRIAGERGLIQSGAVEGKKAIRDRIRERPGGEIEWQKLQAEVYGPRMGEAELFAGVTEFLQGCAGLGVCVYVVSHKTEFANYDNTRTNLREAAMAFLECHGVIGNERRRLSRDRVYFAPTRREKLERIAQLDCSHFIDDLEETFQEESFPPSVEGILFAPDSRDTTAAGLRVCATWTEIGSTLLAEKTGRMPQRTE